MLPLLAVLILLVVAFTGVCGPMTPDAGPPVSHAT